MTDQHRTDTMAAWATHTPTPLSSTQWGESGFALHRFTPPRSARRRAPTHDRQAPAPGAGQPRVEHRHQVSDPRTTYTQGATRRRLQRRHRRQIPLWITRLTPSARTTTPTGVLKPGQREYVAWLESSTSCRVRAHDLWRGASPAGATAHHRRTPDQPAEATSERFLADDREAARARPTGKTGTKPSASTYTLRPPSYSDEWFDPISTLTRMEPSKIRRPPSASPDPGELRQSTSSFTNEQWKKLIAVYWGYNVAMIDFRDRAHHGRGASWHPGRHGGLLLARTTGVHRLAPLNDKAR